jgi:hypothetical protein
VFGPRKEKIKREWRKLRKKELHNFSSNNIIWMIKSRECEGGYVAHVTYTHKMLAGKAERKRPLGRPRSRWKNGLFF